MSSGRSCEGSFRVLVVQCRRVLTLGYCFQRPDCEEGGRACHGRGEAPRGGEEAEEEGEGEARQLLNCLSALIICG